MSAEPDWSVAGQAGQGGWLTLVILNCSYESQSQLNLPSSSDMSLSILSLHSRSQYQHHDTSVTFLRAPTQPTDQLQPSQQPSQVPLLTYFCFLRPILTGS
jgi:hypothetical protein